ncbi:response regulator [soil metagenome]
MTTLLHVLILADRLDDAEPLLHELRKAAYELEWRQVATEADFLAALEWRPELILATADLPHLTALRALELLQTRDPGSAFIVIANSNSEAGVVHYMQQGAIDYVVKDRLARLAPAVTRAIAQTKNRQQHRQTALALPDSETMNRAILDSVSNHIVVLDSEGTIMLVNEAWERFSQENGDSSLLHTGVGVNYLDVCRRVQGEDQATAQAALAGIEGMLQGKLTYFDPLEYACHSPTIKRWFLLQITPLPNHLGGVVVSHINITERKQAEMQQRQQDRLAVVGQLAAGIAHDFNNTLSVITLYSHLLLQTPDRSADETEYLTLISRQTSHAARLIAQIMDFSRQSLAERYPLELKTFLTPLVTLLRRTLPEDIRIKLAIEKRDLMVNADLTRLEQVLMNLAVNARDAMPHGGALQIAVSRLDIKPNTLPPVQGMPAGPWIAMTISDTGVGIAPSNLSHIFEPFFTTKTRSNGTGLGLAQVYGIIRQHEGFIDVKSEVGQGTSFMLYLPALVLPAVKTPMISSGLQHTGQGELILIVEDDRGARDATANILQLLNYEVLKARNGKEAITLFGKHAERIALVLCDLIMPVMDGTTLYKRLAKRWPSVKMIIMTGYTTDIQDQIRTQPGIVDWLSKPFDIDQVAHSLQRALHSDTGTD